MTTTTRPVRREVTWTLPEEPADPADDLRSYLLAIHQLDPDALLLMVEHLAKRRAAFLRQIAEGQVDSDGLWMSDPDTVEGESRVSEEQDARNSRPEPY